MYSGEQQRVRATLKIGVDLGDSSVDLMDLYPESPIETKAPPSYNTATTSPYAHPDSVSQPSATFAASYGRQHIRRRSNSNGYIRITVLVAVPSDATNSSSHHSPLCGVLGDLTDSETSVTDPEDSSSYSDPEDEWDQVLPRQPFSPSTEEWSLHSDRDSNRAQG